MITCGPVWVAVDPMRVISNRSSGELGHLIAQKLKNKGADVTLLEGQVTHPWDPGKITVKKFRFFDELNVLLRKELKKKFDVIIHLAAVADFELQNRFRHKISSNLKQLKLTLIPTKKLIDDIKKIKPKAMLIGFKFEPRLGRNSIGAKISHLFKRAHCDLVVINSIKEHQYKGYIVNRSKNILARADSRSAMAQNLAILLSHRL